MDLSNRRLSSTDNVRYVSENNLQQILLSLVEYQQKAQETTLKMKMSTKMTRTWKMPQRRDNAGAVCDSGMGMLFLNPQFLSYRRLLHQKMG